MIVAVFGDVHGNLPGMYGLCARWEQENGSHIDLVLQTGDIGLWRSVEEMDKATRRHFEKDESELFSAPYLSTKKTAPIETWFIHGNHENFSVLRGSPDSAVDPAGKMVFLAPGSVRTHTGRGRGLRVAGLGGMEYRFGKHPIPSGERIQKYLHPPSLEKLKRSNGSIDVLLLHDAPFNKGLRRKFPTGSRRLTRLIETLQPGFAFYGHYDDPPEPFHIGETFCAGTNFSQARRILNRDGAMGILQTDGWRFDFVQD